VRDVLASINIHGPFALRSRDFFTQAPVFRCCEERADLELDEALERFGSSSSSLVAVNRVQLPGSRVTVAIFVASSSGRGLAAAVMPPG
jgi:hypothetical protein